MNRNFGTDRKVLPQGISMLNLKALSFSVQKLMSQGQNFWYQEKGLATRKNTRCMKAPSLLVKNLCL